MNEAGFFRALAVLNTSHAPDWLQPSLGEENRFIFFRLRALTINIVSGVAMSEGHLNERARNKAYLDDWRLAAEKLDLDERLGRLVIAACEEPTSRNRLIQGVRRRILIALKLDDTPECRPLRQHIHFPRRGRIGLLTSQLSL